MRTISEFTKKVIEVVSLIPPGKVVSYGQVAAYVGVPRAARQVGWTLRTIEDIITIPWWRVINNTGRISIEGNMHNDKHIQRKLLEQEGIVVKEDFTLSIESYRFKADEALLRKWHLSESYREKLLIKYGL